MKQITDEQLNLMFNNFAKISQWLSKGKEAKYPLPFIFETLFSEIETLKNEMAELKKQIKPLDNTAQEDIGDSLQAEPQSKPETQPLPSSSSFTMEEVETGEINEDAFIELDKQLNNLLTE